jgi:hypothetical protein
MFHKYGNLEIYALFTELVTVSFKSFHNAIPKGNAAAFSTPLIM